MSQDKEIQKSREYKLGANRMKKEIIRRIKEWWYADETHIDLLLRRINGVKV